MFALPMFEILYAEWVKTDRYDPPVVTPVIGVAIYSEMEVWEPFRDRKPGSTERSRSDFAASLYSSALQRFPVSMARAKAAYLAQNRWRASALTSDATMKGSLIRDIERLLPLAGVDELTGIYNALKG